MPVKVLYTAQRDGKLFNGPAYGAGMGWKSGECRDIEDDCAKTLLSDFPDMFEIQTAAAKEPTKRRAPKSPAKKTTTRKKAAKAKGKSP